MGEPMSDPVLQIFEREGEHAQTSGNAPILLEGQDRVWCILSGHAEVFSVTLKDGRLAGPKEHFFSAKTGNLLFGMDLSESMGQGFQAVGYPGTKVACLPLDRVKAIAGEEACQDRLLAAVSRVAGVLGLNVAEPRHGSRGANTPVTLEEIARRSQLMCAGISWPRSWAGSGSFPRW